MLLTATLLLLFNVLFLRVLLTRRERRNQAVIESWQPVLFDCLDAVPDKLPELKKGEAHAFLSLWGHLYDNLLDLSRDNLTTAALAVHADQYARKMLRSGSLQAKLVAATSLGQMRAKAAWRDLAKAIASPQTTLSLAAAKALVRIDAEQALPLLMNHIGQREDWSTARISDILREAGPDLLSEKLAQAALTASAETANGHRPAAARFIRHLDLAHEGVAVPAIRQLLAATHQAGVEILEAGLKLTSNPADAPAARFGLGHPHWRVRLQAVGALGRIGTLEEDEAGVISLLNDPEWWVRYRSAQALFLLYNFDETRMRQTQTSHHDNFARDMLEHVIAENRLAQAR